LACAKRPKVEHTVVRIEQNGHGVTLSADSVAQVRLCTLAFLLNTGLGTRRWRFFTDGQCSLQNTRVARFSWYPGVSLLADGVYRVKQCKEALSLALPGRALRHRPLRPILRWVWFGLLDRAIDYLQAIPNSQIQSAHAREQLVGYLERHRPWIPFYA
jgi:hypothetical protein